MKRKPKFRKEKKDGFYNDLKNHVELYIKGKTTEVSYLPGFKSIILGIIYLSSCISLYIFNGSVLSIYGAYLTGGLCMVMIALNVVHEASHGVLFRNKTLNGIMRLWLEVLGTDSNLYKSRHVTYHHTYPNIKGHDADLSQSPLVRVIPHDEFREHHRFQPFFFPILYLFYTLNWFIWRDFDDYFFNRKRYGAGRGLIYKLIFQKAAVVMVLIILPFMNSSLPGWVFVTGYLIYHASASLVAVMAVGSAHVNENSKFPLPDDENQIKNSWAIHQVETAQDFSTGNPLINILFGGFNFHVAHHLFPNMPSRYYPHITTIIKDVCKKHGIEYKHKSLTGALYSHFRLIIKNSSEVHLEVDM